MPFCFVASLINLREQKDVAPLETGTKSINIEKTINRRMLDAASHAATAFSSKKFINVYQNFKFSRYKLLSVRLNSMNVSGSGSHI